ncbi:MAG: hypothetical protein JXL97_16995 [Bacteroidales bacterium]|nr:hypothetical protein [Bacteroidales bacterium]
MKLKNLPLLLVAVLTLGFIFSGCEKQEITKIESKKTEINTIGTELFYPKHEEILVRNGILVFKDLESFRKTYRELDSINNLYLSKISNIFQNLSDKESIELSESIEIDYNLVYSSFENSLYFRSLRAEIQDKIDEYNKIFDQEEIYNPDNYYISDVTLRALLNKNGEVIIENSIFVFMTEEITVEIFNLDFTILEKLNINSLTNLEKEGIIKVYGDYENEETYCVECKTTKCRENISTAWDMETWIEDGIKRKIEGKIDIVNNAVLFTHHLKASVKTSYWNGKRWKNWSTYLYAGISGWVYTKNKCDDAPLGYRAKSGNTGDHDNNSFSVTAPMYSNFFSVKPNEITANFEAGEEGTLSTTLIW